MLELIARLEAASGPDRNLDADIALTQGWSEFPGDNWIGPNAEICVPSFTSSIDAALTLVPEGWWLTLDRYSISDDPKPNPYAWRVWLKRMVGDIEGDGPCGLQTEFANGPTPALALCIAALKARHALGNNLPESGKDFSGTASLASNVLGADEPS